MVCGQCPRTISLTKMVLVEKMTFWHSPDGDKDDRPHNHPWEGGFRSTIIHGGYTQFSYWLEDGNLCQSTQVLRQGDINNCPENVFHLVREVLPGTVTHLKANGESKTEWSYLDLDALQYIPVERDPEYLALMRLYNPHQQIGKPLDLEDAIAAIQLAMRQAEKVDRLSTIPLIQSKLQSALYAANRRSNSIFPESFF